MATEREHALMLLDRLLVTLQQSESVPIKLTGTERVYLIRACRRALADHHDPLGLDRSAGGQRDTGGLLSEAMLVHEHVKAGVALREACKIVGDALGRRRDGDDRFGAMEKNYRSHRPELQAVDRFYAARNAGRAHDPADLATIVTGRSRGK